MGRAIRGSAPRKGCSPERGCSQERVLPRDEVLPGEGYPQANLGSWGREHLHLCLPPVSSEDSQAGLQGRGDGEHSPSC